MNSTHRFDTETLQALRSAKIIGVRAGSQAFAEKYPTPASQKWVQGFAEPQRMRTTLELLPG